MNKILTVDGSNRVTSVQKAKQRDLFIGPNGEYAFFNTLSYSLATIYANNFIKNTLYIKVSFFFGKQSSKSKVVGW